MSGRPDMGMSARLDMGMSGRPDMGDVQILDMGRIILRRGDLRPTMPCGRDRPVKIEQVEGPILRAGVVVEAPDAADQAALLEDGQVLVQRGAADLAVVAEGRLRRVAAAGPGIVAIRENPQHHPRGRLQAALLHGPPGSDVTHASTSVPRIG